MKIARLYLEDDDPMLAESYINRASLLQVKLFKQFYCILKQLLFVLFFRLNPKMKNYKYVTKFVMHVY